MALDYMVGLLWAVDLLQPVMTTVGCPEESGGVVPASTSALGHLWGLTSRFCGVAHSLSWSKLFTVATARGFAVPVGLSQRSRLQDPHLYRARNLRLR